MSEFGERLVKSAKQAAEIAKGAAKPGTYRITNFENGKPQVIADFSDEVLTQMDAEIAAEREAAAKKPSREQSSLPKTVERPSYELIEDRREKNQ